MTKKVKSNASWNGLSPEARQVLEGWLFDERLSYNKALQRAKAELGFKGSKTSLRRFYERAAQERTLMSFADAQSLSATVDKNPVSTPQLRRAGMKALAAAFVKGVTTSPENVKAWGYLARLLLYSEENELRRRMLRQDHELRREKLTWDKLTFSYKSVHRAMAAYPELKKLMDAKEESELPKFEQNKKMNDLRRGMFGDVIPELLPENEEEEAHPEIIQRRYEEGYRKLMEGHMRDYLERKKANAELERKRLEAKGIATPEQKMSQEDVEEVLDEQTEIEAEKVEEAPRIRLDTDEPPKKTPEERQREYEELMRHAGPPEEWYGH